MLEQIRVHAKIEYLLYRTVLDEKTTWIIMGGSEKVDKVRALFSRKRSGAMKWHTVAGERDSRAEGGPHGDDECRVRSVGRPCSL